MTSALAEMAPAAAAALFALSLIGGVGITALGPGGVLPTIGLFTLTGLDPAHVAGTAIVTHICTGLLGTLAYSRSGHLRDPDTRRTAWSLAGVAVVGTPLGIALNSAVSERAFSIVLAVFIAAVAVLMWVRQDATPGAVPRASRHPGIPAVCALGLGVAVASGIVGVGGPMLAVPLLVVLGMPVLESLAVAQVQSIVIATVGTIGYLAQGAIDWPLALLVGVPELVGVVIGWKIARMLPTRILQYALIVVLLILAPYLALS